MLDYKKLARSVRSDGGCTISLDGIEPTEGFAVGDGIHSRAQRVSTTRDIENAIYAFVVHNGADLRAGSYLGAWLHDGTLYLDLIELYENLDTALDAAAQRSELAVFDLASKREYAVSV